MAAAAQAKLESLVKAGSSPDILQHIHNHKILEPTLVLKTALPLLRKKLVPSQRLALLEQITIAAIHEQDIPTAEESLTEIKATPGIGSRSLRFCKLLALCLESQAEYDDATRIYDDMITENPSNVYALKRKYIILRCQLKDLEARKCLNEYLEKNPGDASSWVELAKCCLEQGDYKGAAFCYEELVLCSPVDVKTHCILGELYVTIGGKDNYVLARKHFAQSLELDKGCCRAMFGLVSAAESYLDLMESAPKKSKDVDEEDMNMVHDLLKYGVEKLMKSYKGTHMSGLLQSVLCA